MKCYKGFDKNLKCRGFQYEIGKEYTEGNAKICDFGFHACENPLDVFRYYPPSDSRFCEVDLDANDQTHDDSKRVGKHIKIGAEIGITGIIEAGFKFIFNKVDFKKTDKIISGWQSTAATSGLHSTAATSGEHSTAATSGWQSTAATSGWQSTAATSGEHSTAATSGWHSTAATSGRHSTAATSGRHSTAIVNGAESIALANGIDSKSSGALGCYIVLTEWKEIDGAWHLVDVKSAKVDGETIKADTFYKLIDGEFVECEE